MSQLEITEKGREYPEMIKDGVIYINDKPFVFELENKDFISKIAQSHPALNEIAKGAVQKLFEHQYSIFAGKEMSFADIVESIN